MEKKQVTVYSPGVTKALMAKRLKEKIEGSETDFDFDIPTLYGTLSVKSKPKGKDKYRVELYMEGTQEIKEEIVPGYEGDLEQRCWHLASFIVGMIADIALDPYTSGRLFSLCETYLDDLSTNPTDYGFTNPEDLESDEEKEEAYEELESFLNTFTYYDFLAKIVEKEIEFSHVTVK